MFNWGRTWVIAAALMGSIAFGHGALAQGVLYDCDITERDPGVEWISAKVGFVVRPDQVTVVDEIALNFEGAPVVATMRERGGEMRIDWTVNARDSNNNSAQLRYRADLDPSARTVALRVTPVGFTQRWRGVGTCTARRQ